MQQSKHGKQARAPPTEGSSRSVPSHAIQIYEFMANNAISVPTVVWEPYY